MAQVVRLMAAAIVIVASSMGERLTQARPQLTHVETRPTTTHREPSFLR